MKSVPMLLKSLFTTVITTIFLLSLFSAPHNVQAVNMEGDMECIPAIPVCGCHLIMQKGKCVGGDNKYLCPCKDNTNGFTTPGICQLTQQCKATATAEGKGTGLGQVGDIMKGLFDALKGMKGDGGGGGSPASTNPADTCTSMQTTSDPNVAAGNKCFTYVAGSGETGTTTVGGGDGPGGGCSELYRQLGLCGGDTATTTPGSTSTSATLSVTPTSGVAPLTVTFSGTIPHCDAIAHSYGIDFADSESATAITVTPGSCTFTGHHAYQSAAVFVMKLMQDDSILKTVTITSSGSTNSNHPIDLTSITPKQGGIGTKIEIKGEGFTSTGNTLHFGRGIDEAISSSNGTTISYTLPASLGVCATADTHCDNATLLLRPGQYQLSISNANGQSSSLIFTVTATSSSGLSTSTRGNIATLGSGITGNVIVSENGATIVVTQKDIQNNSVTAGFYGSNSFGGQPQGIMGRLCASRPWATDFFSRIIPASFFDSLCTWRGYPVGALVSHPTATHTTPTSTFRNISTSTKPRSNTASTSAPVSTVTSKVQIWAVPASVPLGSRTSIFWNTQGVTNCTETSPDGSFSQNTLSGGASTVPLSGATTFSISCLDSNGKPVTNFVTVKLKI